ncbi:D-alanyl-D-alanine carboxypeptidase/D-alanyl-D-alanine-endopeptidase [Neobacillus mesonae]|uniref:D-alanyl-D-alanine carboxypeptidase/D-alanyl-D-alanine endopeptidase n=1 Tax=Neobacillus mesonae TaxID=1193713 RepID=UPI00204234D4|nr:D-alanyl-D-alanine carboxypeptidase/D-alanyl-D-alanine-endopeptidase [Neobacillus mesonae]MCM3570354.1 D-alanyl-D-alanine carboxypeptidase/D-alanyl-D-alanine-endopeptidase [Neobacillus mesonae]
MKDIEGKDVEIDLFRNSKYLIIFVLFMIVVTIIPSTQAQAAAGNHAVNTWSQKLDSLLRDEPDLQGAIAGISIRNASDGKIVYDHQGDIRLRPASNMKLLTAAAALNVLGEDYTFSTEIYLDGQMKKKTLKGNLYLKGKGDPTLMKTDFDQMAKILKKQGIAKIEGNVIGDDSWFDDIRYSKDLPWSDETTYYGAQISALTASPTTDFDAGAVKVEVKPVDRVGDRPMIKISPKTDYIKIINRAVTVNKDGKKKITIEREHGKNTIAINGTIPITAKEVTEWPAVWDTSLYALTLFKQAMKENDIKLEGEIKKGLVPETAKIIHTHHSMPLSELLVPFMKLSNNTHAEILTKEMGKEAAGEGSWKTGLTVLKTELAKFGADANSMVLRDGSGISHVTSVQANQISQLLFAVQKEKWFSVYLNALPISGEQEKMTGGSLRYRMKTQELKGKVMAKTGTLSSVSSLSGYIETKSGQRLIFSILLNNLLDEEKGKRIEDKIVSIIANQ